MGLKNIHLLFISMAVAAVPGVRELVGVDVRVSGDPASYLAAAVVAVSAAVGLVVYGGWFLRKMKGLHTP